MIRFTLLLFLIFLNLNLLFSQEKPVTKNIKISVLTIGPGTSLNDAFGHNAFRVKGNAVDVVYDYGRFDFDAPNFYLNFAKGKLNYFMGEAPYYDFLRFYKMQDRTVKEQILNLSNTEKHQLINYLYNNRKPENRNYLYDFFYDNCATKMRDVLKSSISETINFKASESLEPKTFRTLIQDNLHWNTWGSFGIDIALGAVIDKQVTPDEYMFLPEYIHQFFSNAKLNKKALVASSKVVHQGAEKNKKTNFLFSPLFVLCSISFIILFITYKDYKSNHRSKWLDVVIFITTGLIGIVILLLWFATDHSATAFNYNLLWAFAINIFVTIQVVKNTPKKWFRRYVKFLLIMLVLMVFHWSMKLQVFALVLIPILVALAVRYVFLVKHLNTKTTAL